MNIDELKVTLKMLDIKYYNRGLDITVAINKYHKEYEYVISLLEQFNFNYYIILGDNGLYISGKFEDYLKDSLIKNEIIGE